MVFLFSSPTIPLEVLEQCLTRIRCFSFWLRQNAGYSNVFFKQSSWVQDLTWKFVYRSDYYHLRPKKLSHRPENNDVLCQSPCFPINCGFFSYVIRSWWKKQQLRHDDMTVTPGMCRLAPKSKRIKIKSFDGNFDVPFEFDMKTKKYSLMDKPLAKLMNALVAKSNIKLLKRFCNVSLLPIATGPRKFPIGIGRKKIPCILMEDDCKTTSPGLFAYTWDTPENCLKSKILTQNAKMLHYQVTTDQKENQFFFPSEFNETGKEINRKLKVFSESYELCRKRERLYRTNFESLFVN